MRRAVRLAAVSFIRSATLATTLQRAPKIDALFLNSLSFFFSFLVFQFATRSLARSLDNSSCCCGVAHCFHLVAIRESFGERVVRRVGNYFVAFVIKTSTSTPGRVFGGRGSVINIAFIPAARGSAARVLRRRY